MILQAYYYFITIIISIFISYYKLLQKFISP